MKRIIVVLVNTVLTGALFGLCALTLCVFVLMLEWLITYLHTIHPALGYGTAVGVILGCVFGVVLGFLVVLED